MQNVEPTPKETETLGRLGAEEDVLDRELKAAEEQARQRVADAESSAAMVRNESQSQIDAAVAQLLSEAKGEADRTAIEVQAAAKRRLEAIETAAAKNQDAVVAWIVARVRGEPL